MQVAGSIGTIFQFYAYTMGEVLGRSRSNEEWFLPEVEGGPAGPST